MKVKKILGMVVDATDSFMAFVMVFAGVGFALIIEYVKKKPDAGWTEILGYMATPQFIILAFFAVSQTGQEETKGMKDDVAKAAKKANYWSRMERAFSRGFTYGTVGVVA